MTDLCRTLKTGKSSSRAWDLNFEFENNRKERKISCYSKHPVDSRTRYYRNRESQRRNEQLFLKEKSALMHPNEMSHVLLHQILLELIKPVLSRERNHRIYLWKYQIKAFFPAIKFNLRRKLYRNTYAYLLELTYIFRTIFFRTCIECRNNIHC